MRVAAPSNGSRPALWARQIDLFRGIRPLLLALMHHLAESVSTLRPSFTSFALPLLLAVFAGVAQAWALAWPFGVQSTDVAQWTTTAPWWSFAQAGQPSPGLQVFAMALLAVLLVAAPNPRAAAWRGWVFGTAWLCATFWWLFVSMHTYGGLAAPLAVLAVLALALFLSSSYALISYVFSALALDGIGFKALVFASLWTLAELMRAVLFTGFPWGAVGYAHVNSLGWAAPWVGVYGVGWLAALVSAALGLACARVLGLGVVNAAFNQQWPTRHKARHRIFGPVSTLAGVVVLGALLMEVGSLMSPMLTRSSGAMPVVLLQGNIAQDEKFQAGSGVPKALAWYAMGLAGRGSAHPPGALIVAPETALPLLPQQLGPEFWTPLLTALARQQHAVLTGLPLGNAALGYANAAWGITPAMAKTALAELAQHGQPAFLDGSSGSQVLSAAPHGGAAAASVATKLYRYEKHHLVPFGEFIPPAFKWFVDLMNIPLGDFNRGALGQAPLHWAGQRVATNICYEDLFGDELAAGFTSEDRAPTVLVNLSNLAWFGNTVALDQHLHISRLRALELGRPMVRATNTGATVVIDHQGRVTHALARQTQGELSAIVDGREGLTPYARWASSWGLWPMAMLSCLGVASGVWASIWRRRRNA